MKMSKIWFVAVSGVVAIAALGGGCSGSGGDNTDAGVTCTAPQIQCGLGCTDTSKDPDNCGGCAKACTGGQVCSQGACALSCAGGTTQCGQSCLDTKVDPANCGACGKACATGQACVAGACTSQCMAGQKLCATDAGAFCANTATDNQNCGGCGVTCGAAQVCSNGACGSGCGGSVTTSDAGDGGSANPETYCAPDGGVPYCADTTADNANCGACGTVCGSGTKCVGGSCAPCESILVINTAATAPANLLAGIQATSPTFCTVAYYAANSATPSIAALSPYTAILVANDIGGGPYSDPTGLGNVLATYFDNGGRVVVALFATGGYALGGNFASKYMLINAQNVPSSADSYDGTNSAQDLSPTSPVLAGVNAINGTGWHGTQTVKNGGAAIAKWASGDLLAVTGTVTDANSKTRNRVDLNILPTEIASQAWTGDGFRLLGNALEYK